MNLRLSGLVVAAALLSSSPAWAHHSFAMFDTTKPTTIEGTVKELQWTNPHIFIEVLVKEPTGKVVQWSIEGLPPPLLKRRGWTSKSIKPGDKVTITMFPLRSGDLGGGLDKILVNGQPIGIQAAPAAAAPTTN